MNQVVIASRLSDGRVVFLSNQSKPGAASWLPLLGDGVVIESNDRAAELLTIGEADVNERHEVIDPYLIDVEEKDGQLRPTKYREAIRCLGPTNRRDLGKQSEGAQA